MHYLYRITNTVNGKVYIGQTKNLQKRKSQHKLNSTNKHLRNSIKLYGWYSFDFEAIACCKTQEDADYTEIELIKQYDSRNLDVGYNVSPGGYKDELSEESKMKISLAHKGKHYSPDTEFKSGVKQSDELIAKRVAGYKEFYKDKPGPNTGNKHSEESKRKIGAASKGIKRGPMSEETKRKISETKKAKNK